MFKTIAVVAALVSASAASAATVTFSSTDTFTVNNTTFNGFSADVDTDVGSASLTGTLSTLFDDSVVRNVSQTQSIDITATYLGQTLTQTVDFTLRTRNLLTGARPGAAGQLTLVAPVGFDFTDGTFTLEGFDSVARCFNNCPTGSVTDSAGDVNASFEAALSAVPLPAGFGFLLAGMGALGVARRRKDVTAA
ncbi:VPLPA-CTERM sorting domain-containing protein [Octadecabacter sp. CECT 8868]|uniref:VPLPA-CTERM sorting domain-containing protein n=1 Tax=Octadecabacter algicola TaxID=2909342 RepID=UPI001F35A69A|nr:VPLPA-CTERM sorting domain-containing protein [Octadecabacter algicola]MCF2905124.1 VPLPA-CTERM sorting domain-containing protein [Octadecabacter algicola]